MMDNTMIIVTSDNGMAFPYAKANCTEYGIHMPLAVCWKKKIPANQTVSKLVGFIDLTATIHHAFDIKNEGEHPISGKSFLDLLKENQKTITPVHQQKIFAGRERHSSSRYNTLGYPQRCIRTNQFLLVRNYKPERWPAGPGQKNKKGPNSELGPKHNGYHDIDACPTLDYLIKGRSDSTISKYFHLAVSKRNYEQLFNIIEDPYCINDLVGKPEYKEKHKELADQLTNYLVQTKDPRENGNGDIFESYPRYSSIRWFPTPNWAKDNPETIPPTPWLKTNLRIKK